MEIFFVFMILCLLFRKGNSMDLRLMKVKKDWTRKDESRVQAWKRDLAESAKQVDDILIDGFWWNLLEKINIF